MVLLPPTQYVQNLPQHCLTSGFRRGVNEVYAILGYCTASIGTMRRLGTTCHIFKGQAVQEDCLTLEDGTDRSSRNVAKYQSTLCNIPEERRSYPTFFCQAVTVIFFFAFAFHNTGYVFRRFSDIFRLKVFNTCA